MSAEAFAVGIDFGSTNYRTAYRFGGDLVTVPDPPGTAALRTFLLASDDPRPRLRLVGLKSYLGDDERVASREGRLTSQQAVAYELRQVRELAATYAGGAVEYGVVALPSRYDARRRELLRQAGQAAGFRGLAFVDDVSAALRGHTLAADASRTILVVSWGFIGFECSVVRVVRQQIRSIAHDDCEWLSGAEIDLQIAAACAARLRTASQRPELRWEEWGRLVQLAQAGKEEVVIHANTIIRLPAELTAGPELAVPLDTTHLDAFAAPLVDQACDSIRRALAESRLDAAHIDEVLMIGGSTNLPRFRERLAEMVPAPVIPWRADLLARGAALVAAETQFAENLPMSAREPTPSVAVVDALVEHVRKLVDDGLHHEAQTVLAEVHRRSQAILARAP